MYKFAAPLFLLLLTSAALSQVKPSPTTTPRPTPADDTDVVKITTTLIQIDVTVTDKKGNIITDLRPDEIEILENGEKQKITSFAFVSNVKSTDAGAKPAQRPGVDVPTAPPRLDQVRRTIALVVDDLTLSFESTYFVRRALKKFVDEQMQPGDLVAIIRTGAGIGALQQFTNDKRQLYAAIERVRWNAAGAGNIGAFAPLQGRLADDPRGTSPSAGALEEGMREFDEFRESVFATGTLGAINYVVRGMQDLPGRKSIMLLSDGFRMFTTDAEGNRDYDRVYYALRRLVDMANRASVVVYTMDARGLQIGGLTAEDDTSGFSFEQMAEEQTNRRNRLIDTQEGLRYLARQTGGLAIVNTNDLSGGIRKVLDDQSYYLIAYEPDEGTFDPKSRRFNKLEVKVTRPGTRARYRSGFFGVSDDKIAKPVQTTEQRMNDALTSPFAVSDIALRLNAIYYNAGGKDPNMIRSFLHVGAKDLKFADLPNGAKKAEFEIVAIGFGDNGAVMSQIGKGYTIELKKDTYERVTRDGFVYQFFMPMKKSGAYQLRIAFRDRLSNRIGSANQFIEVPDLKKDRLVLSGVLLEAADYNAKGDGSASGGDSTAMKDTALRQFKRGTALAYGFAVYNAKTGPSGPSLTYQVRIFRDGQPIYEGQPRPIPPDPTNDPRGLNVASAIALGTGMTVGDYVLQIVVTDSLAKAKRNTATQYVQFEVVE